MADFYVYEWYVKNTNEVIYVGKGKGNRYKTLRGRNKFFLDMYNTHECDVRIVKDNLSEKDAFEEERKLIRYYRDNHPEYRLTNQSDGGEGNSGWVAPEEYRENMRIKNTGKNNPNYNNRWTQEQKKRASERITGRYVDENNPNSHRVMCVETGVIYPTVKAAVSEYGIADHSNMCAAFDCYFKTAGGVHWVREEMFDSLKDVNERRKYLIKCYIDNHKYRPLICCQTEKLYQETSDLAKELGVKKSKILYDLNKYGCYINNGLKYVDLRNSRYA